MRFKNEIFFLDILRILGGILFLNAFYHGGSHQLQHGVSRKWLNTDYLKFRLFNANNPLNLTISELSLYNGTDKHLPIYLAIDGIVLMCLHHKVYGPGGPYHE